ncbi:MAG: hypothetical protein ACE5FS_00565 [Paracoccaceae bacterium]
MSERFADLKKIAREPAARLLATANAKLQTKVKAPASASVEAVLEELDENGAVVDMLRILSLALPARERVWWACLAARDLVGQDVEPAPPPLAAAEKWVFKPTDENREAAREALELAEMDDQTELCATAVIFCDGKIGTGDLADVDAPPGGSATAAFVMNATALSESGEKFDAYGQLLVDRALDIARGGSGRLDGKPAEPADG